MNKFSAQLNASQRERKCVWERRRRTWNETTRIKQHKKHEKTPRQNVYCFFLTNYSISRVSTDKTSNWLTFSSNFHETTLMLLRRVRGSMLSGWKGGETFFSIFLVMWWVDDEFFIVFLLLALSSIKTYSCSLLLHTRRIQFGALSHLKFRNL